jgi:hypothetical protein
MTEQHGSSQLAPAIADLRWLVEKSQKEIEYIKQELQPMLWKHNSEAADTLNLCYMFVTTILLNRSDGELRSTQLEALKDRAIQYGFEIPRQQDVREALSVMGYPVYAYGTQPGNLKQCFVMGVPGQMQATLGRYKFEIGGLFSPSPTTTIGEYLSCDSGHWQVTYDPHEAAVALYVRK